MKSWAPPTKEVINKALASVKKETDRQYFFSRLNNPLWVGPLRELEFFDNPPSMKKLPNGYVQYPPWPELTYLLAIAAEATDEVVDIVLSLPKTDNPRVYDDILSIALKIEGHKSALLLPKLIEYIELDHPFQAHRYAELLQHWADQENHTQALQIAKLLVSFREDPRTREKRKLRIEEPNSFGTWLEPTPRFQHHWEYQQILDKGVRRLAEHEPLQVANLLIDAVAGMIRMGMHQEDFDKGHDEDHSEIWCQRLDESNGNDHDAKEALVKTLTYACTQVYDNAPESIDVLDLALRNQRWKVFRRLRQHLYALHPNDQTLPWIREQILGHADYSRWVHQYEFQLMIRRASEYFGLRLLSEHEQRDIYDSIRTGQTREDLREWMKEQYSEEAFQQSQHKFHRKQLRPFATLLSGEVRHYYDELKVEAQAEAITDESYLPYSGVTGGTVSYRSPKSAEDLESLTDEEILTYLNDWNDEHRDKDNWLVRVNISALSDTFQALFKEQVLQNGERLSFWMLNRDRIARPVYIVAILKAMIELVKEKKFDNLHQWIEFSAWVLSHSDSTRIEGQPDPRDESSEDPDWGSSRRAVIDFIDACVNKDTNTPITAREGIANLLQQASTQFDWRLDHDQPVFVNGDEPVTEAINNTRSRALDSLVRFSFWVQRHLPEDRLSELTEILTKRIVEDSEIPLTRPEHALIGMHFGNLYILNRDWAVQQLRFFFPHGNASIWRDTFGSYIRFNRPIKLMFEVLRDEFVYAIENLNKLSPEEDDQKELVDSLGEHLFAHYLWEEYPLAGDKSLLHLFYDKTRDDRERWSRLFDHVGRTLSNHGTLLGKALADRIVAFFEWRYNVGDSLELQEFGLWLDAECMPAEWRLKSYLQVLKLRIVPGRFEYGEIQAINKLLSQFPELVVQCFAACISSIDRKSPWSVPFEEAQAILLEGLKSTHDDTRKYAEQARENLLKIGRFDFM